MVEELHEAGPADSPGVQTEGLGDQVRGYYREVLRFLEEELADRGDGPFWERLAQQPLGCRVLELGAGYGRATEFFARSASRVVAVDLSAELIARARRGLTGHSNVALVVADMRSVRFAAAFDLVVAVDDPFAHLTRDEDRDQALRAVAEHLAPGGRFILDAAWFSPSRRRLAASPSGLTLERVHGAGAGALTVREHWRCKSRPRLCRACFEYFRHGRREAEASFDGRLWSVAELIRRCRAAGLELACLWGDYDGRPWRRGTSRRLIAAAVHRGEGKR